MQDAKRENSLTVKEEQGHPRADKEPGPVVHTGRTLSLRGRLGLDPAGVREQSWAS